MKEIEQSIKDNLDQGKFKMSDYPLEYQGLTPEQLAQIIEDETDISYVPTVPNQKGQISQK